MPSIEEKPEDDGNDRKRSPERVESDRRSSNGESRTEPQQRSDKRQRVASNSSKSRPKSGRKFLTAYNIYFRDERRRILDSGVSTDDLYESEVVPTLRTTERKKGFQALTQVISLRWKNLSASLQAEYQARALEYNTKGEKPSNEAHTDSHQQQEQRQQGPVYGDTGAHSFSVPSQANHDTTNLIQSLTPILQGLQQRQEMSTLQSRALPSGVSLPSAPECYSTSRAPVPGEPAAPQQELIVSILQYLVSNLSRSDYHDRTPGVARPSVSDIQGPRLPISGLESMSNGEVLQAIWSLLQSHQNKSSSSQHVAAAQQHQNHSNDLHAASGAPGPDMSTRSTSNNDLVAKFQAALSASVQSTHQQQTLMAQSEHLHRQSQNGALSQLSSPSPQPYPSYPQNHSAVSTQQHPFQRQQAQEVSQFERTRREHEPQVELQENLLATIQAILNRSASNNNSNPFGGRGGAGG